MNLGSILNLPPAVLSLLLVWSIFWKLLAVWRASKLDQKYWFIALFIINSFGIVEILYLFVFAKKKITVSDLRPENLFPSKV